MSEFSFDEPENLAVFACNNVLRLGKPVLRVSHDADGEWQFLCGGIHSEQTDDGICVVCLRDIVERDQTLNEVATLCPLNSAERDSVGSPWRIEDQMEEIVLENVREHGCHVMMIEADEDGPAFAYSIGLAATPEQSELICFGLRTETMHVLINEMRARMAKGERFSDGERVSDLIKGYDCVLKKVQLGRYREYLGYARWFHDGDGFDVLQIVWPDKQHRFPWDENYSIPRNLQPATWLDDDSFA
jgi:hypothetical protein